MQGALAMSTGVGYARDPRNGIECCLCRGVCMEDKVWAGHRETNLAGDARYDPNGGRDKVERL